MREFLPEEVETYDKVRERHPELNLKEYSSNFRIEEARDGILTLVKIYPVGDKEEESAPFLPTLIGRAIFSVEDRRKKQKNDPKIGRSVAFHRALHSPLVWE